ncbi:MAG: DMT family transporter [Anaerolineaceae bacterium]|nr:DMT family transporter [Anaerolineaceae bacterium]
MPPMRLKGNLILLLVAIIWGVAFVAQRVAAQTIGPFLFNGARFLLAAAVLLPFTRPAQHKPKKSALPWMGAAGVLLFAASGLQQAGMRWTTAANAGFITTLYVVFVPLLLLIFWRQRLPWLNWAAAFLAITGVKLLSSPGQLHLSPGDGLELAGSVVWALHVILVSRAAERLDALQFSLGQYLVCGLLNLVAAFWLDWESISGLLIAGWAIVFGGIVSVGLGHTLQVVGQKYSPPTDAALILSSEAVFAALSGYLFLKEGLQPIQLAGCGLILAAILIAQLWGARQSAGQTHSPALTSGLD